MDVNGRFRETGYSVTVARVLWEDLVPVRIRLPRIYIEQIRGIS